MARPETPFTTRMRQLCEEAPRRVPNYHPTRFRQMVEACGGDFAPKAKQLLRGPVNAGLVRLAHGGAIGISMEAVICEPQWSEFSQEDRDLARARIDLAHRLAQSGGAAGADW